jgi:VWFA-related protein
LLIPGGTVKTNAVACFVLLVLLTSPLARAQEADQAPVDLDETERVEVNLVLIETLVLDSKGRTVPDLTKDDFDLVVQGRSVPVDVLDVTCPAGEIPEPVSIPMKEPRVPAVPDAPRKIVLLVDYYHLGYIDRTQAMGRAFEAVLKSKTPSEEIMVAALANGLRIEQRFTRDKEEVLATLDRMAHDVSLYGGFFETVTGRSFFDNLSTLMDVLAEYDGAKSVLMYSTYLGPSADNDLWYFDVAQRAAVGRTVIYPVWGADFGLGEGEPMNGSAGLARLANESGGVYLRRVDDPSRPYARVQRDMGCRYAVGFYIDNADALKARSVRVRVKKRGYEIRAPEIFKLWKEEERAKSRMRAAFIDAERFEDPLLRAFVWPIRPRSAKAWDGLVALHFPLSVGPGGAEREIGLNLFRGQTSISTFQGAVKVDPPADESSEPRPVTIYGDGKIKPGAYKLNVVLAEPGGKNLQTTTAEFVVPEVPSGELFVRGPVLTRVARGGILVRADEGKSGNRGEEELKDLIGADSGLEPLLIHDVESEDTVVAIWDACQIGGSYPGPGTTVERRILTRQGEVLHAMDPVPLKLEGKKVRCHGRLDRVQAGTLEPGSYWIQVRIMAEGQDEPLTQGRVPLHVR